MSPHMPQGDADTLTHHEQEGRAEAPEARMTSVPPQSLRDIQGEQGVRFHTDLASGASDMNPDERPEHRGKFHRVAIARGIRLDSVARACSLVKERTDKVEAPATTRDDDDNRPAQTSQSTRAATSSKRGAGRRRRGGAIGENEELVDTGKIGRQGRFEGKPSSSMQPGHIPEIRAQPKPRAPFF